MEWVSELESGRDRSTTDYSTMRRKTRKKRIMERMMIALHCRVSAMRHTLVERGMSCCLLLPLCNLGEGSSTIHG